MQEGASVYLCVSVVWLFFFLLIFLRTSHPSWVPPGVRVPHFGKYRFTSYFMMIFYKLKKKSLSILSPRLTNMNQFQQNWSFFQSWSFSNNWEKRKCSRHHLVTHFHFSFFSILLLLVACQTSQWVGNRDQTIDRDFYLHLISTKINKDAALAGSLIFSSSPTQTTPSDLV